ncbi:MAG: helix-turn-helix transcriptional regulator [Clostridia bacterium]|nr:helix-turn-helix transcriptional regulator [Clostridia bacterium]
MHFYRRLRDMREDHDKTQSEIAAVLQTTQSYYAQYESCKRSIPFERVIVLARFYNVSLDYLAGLIDVPEPLDRHVKK